jgi:hypothetical protein
MRNIFSIRNRLLSLIAVSFILAQSIFSVAALSFHTKAKNEEVKKEISSKVSFVEVFPRITVPLFFFYWFPKILAVNIPDIDYHNCTAFFVNSHSFNAFYIFTSALAP